MNALIGIAVSVCITSASPAATTPAKPAAEATTNPRSAAEFRQAVEEALSAEAAAKSSAERAAALRVMATLSKEIADHPTLGKHTAASLRGRVGGRLKRARNELVAAAVDAKRPQVANLTLRPIEETVLAQQAGGIGPFDAPAGDGAEALADLIQETIAPPTWERNGGLGVIGFFARGGAAGDGQLAQVPARGNNGGPVPLVVDADVSEELIDLIQQTIAPASWDVNGGEGVAIFFAPKGALVVRQTDEVHGGLVDVVNQLKPR
jgi:hypothetical protein